MSNCQTSWSSKLNEVVCPADAVVNILDASQANFSFTAPDNASAYLAELMTATTVRGIMVDIIEPGLFISGSFTGLSLNLAEAHFLRLTFYVASPNQCLITPTT